MNAKQDQLHSSTQTLEVSAFRYSDDPRAMGEFLELLGLSTRVSNDAGSWLELQAAHGSVSLHATGEASTASAAPGTTDLVLIAEDVPAFAAGLAQRDDLEVVVWDESFGHQAEVTFGGRKVIINEIQPDPYGYQVTEPTPGPVTVISHCYTADFDAAQALLVELGFRRSLRGATEDTVRLASSSTGVIVLHRTDDAEDRYGVGIETEADLGQLAERLEAAGHASHFAADGHGLEFTDPDGQPMLVTER